VYSTRGPVLAIGFSADGTFLDVARPDQTLSRLEISTGTTRPIAGVAPVAARDATAPSRGLRAYAEADRVLLQDTQTGSTRTLAGHRGEVVALAFSPDGEWLASVGKDETIRLWKTRPPSTEAPESGEALRQWLDDLTSLQNQP
jgi:WD40 repeat protein